MLGVLAITFSLVACASSLQTYHERTQSSMPYTFTFDTSETPDVKILDFFYGDETAARTIRNPEYLRKRNQSLQSESIYAHMPANAKLYVKWHINSTGLEYEDKVDLSNKLSNGIKINYLTFMIKGSQLYIFLVTPERRSADILPIGPKLFQAYKTLIIYPD